MKKWRLSKEQLDWYAFFFKNLPDIFLPEFSLRYLKLECQLGEIDRARAIFIYGCQFANPARYKDFWEEWKNFEVDNGNDETFREMLRMKRTIEAQNTNANVVNNKKIQFSKFPVQISERK